MLATLSALLLASIPAPPALPEWGTREGDILCLAFAIQPKPSDIVSGFYFGRLAMREQRFTQAELDLAMERVKAEGDALTPYGLNCYTQALLGVVPKS